jgi:hypothetical protein
LATSTTTTERPPAAPRVPPQARGPGRNGQLAIFVALCAVCLVAGVLYLSRAGQRAPGGDASGALMPPQATSLDAVRSGPYATLRSTTQDGSFGRVVLAPLGQPEGGRFVSDLRCERVYYAAGQGICLQADRGVITTYQAVFFDAQLRPQQSVPLQGIPSRARVSPDGRYAAMTVFVSGHSYADGGFSTHTTIFDVASGAELGELEQFAVYRDGERIQAPDFNFWGVTFARDSNRFFATLGTAGKTYLLEGDLQARRLRVLREGVECPSLSPDNTRIAFKRLVSAGSRPVWQVAVLDLATLQETVLTLETHSVDDQIEWLDDEQVVYGLPAETATPSARTDVWALRVDGSAPPRLLLKGAWSPAIARA